MVDVWWVPLPGVPLTVLSRVPFIVSQYLQWGGEGVKQQKVGWVGRSKKRVPSS
jgi:hypothetical protein